MVPFSCDLSTRWNVNDLCGNRLSVGVDAAIANDVVGVDIGNGLSTRFSSRGHLEEAKGYVPRHMMGP